MENLNNTASDLLREFKGGSYIFGTNCIDQLGSIIPKPVKRVAFVMITPDDDWARPVKERITQVLLSAGYSLAGPIIEGARPNAPKEDVFRLSREIADQNPDAVLTAGAGSTIDATKAALALNTLGDKYPDLNDYFGMGMVSKMLRDTGRAMPTMIAVQLTASSAAHLTKYSNITDLATGQKYLIIDEALVPPLALFDYSFSRSQPASLTMDGGLDGISHCLEVLMGIPEEKYQLAKAICLTGIKLIVNNIKQAIVSPNDAAAREALGLGTDLGGYAIMIGGTNGAHLNSFSMTDILAHGRACALMNPYYIVFFAPAIGNRLKEIANIYREAGYLHEHIEELNGRELGEAIARAMFSLSADIGFPTRLADVQGFTDAHIERCLSAAKDPKLESKLKNMPVPLSAQLVDTYMHPVLNAAKTGDLSLIKNLA